MTSMLDAQTDLIAEVKDRLLSLAPAYEASIRFRVRDETDRALSEHDEATGRPRLFEIGEGVYSAPTYIGATTLGERYVHKISIWYPHDEKWSIGLNSDANMIRRDFLVNSTTVSGVQQRHLDPAAEMVIERDSDDSWQKLILDLVVHYETNS